MIGTQTLNDMRFIWKKFIGAVILYYNLALLLYLVAFIWTSTVWKNIFLLSLNTGFYINWHLTSFVAEDDLDLPTSKFALYLVLCGANYWTQGF